MGAAREAIFIGYRRGDTADVAGRIYDALVNRFGRERVFKDVDNIPVGAEFGDYIKSTLSRCSVALILIGPNWAAAADRDGRRRLDDPHDWVRVEIETALGTPGLQVVPVLINGAHMPAVQTLPESMQPLCKRNAASVRQDPDFHQDLERLGTALTRHVKGGALDLGLLRNRPGRRSPLVIGAVAVIALIAGLVGWRVWSDGPHGPVRESGSIVSTATQAELSRGWQVYREVCAACHSLSGVSYSMLGEAGGPLWDRRFTARENPSVVRETRSVQIVDANAQGERVSRRATITDAIVAPFPNIAAAMNANGAIPPDLVAYSRSRPDAADRILAFLRGYRRTQSERAGSYFNEAAANPDHLTRMPPPLSEGQVAFDDRTPATPEQMSRDVALFIAWAGGVARESGPRQLKSDEEADREFDDLFDNQEVFEMLASRGERLSNQCMACHTFNAGGAATIGPNLHGVYGRGAGAVSEFQYSDALGSSGVIWNGGELDAYLLSPQDAAPGTRMNFEGVREDADRLSIIAYLKSISSN
jgi:cytochrome c2